jgi:hypothetical protein
MPAFMRAYVQFVANIAFRLNEISEQSLGPSISDVIADIAPRPILLISTATGQEQLDNRLFYSLAGEPKTLWELPDVGHIQGIFERPDEYHTTILTFFDDALLQQGTQP